MSRNCHWTFHAKSWDENLSQSAVGQDWHGGTESMSKSGCITLWHTFRIFSRPSSATVTILTSLQSSRSQSGLMQPAYTRYLICWGDPPLVALLMAQAVSFLMSNSAVLNKWTSGGMMLASITACTCNSQSCLISCLQGFSHDLARSSISCRQVST